MILILHGKGKVMRGEESGRDKKKWEGKIREWRNDGEYGSVLSFAALGKTLHASLLTCLFAHPLPQSPPLFTPPHPPPPACMQMMGFVGIVIPLCFLVSFSQHTKATQALHLCVSGSLCRSCCHLCACIPFSV